MSVNVVHSIALTLVRIRSDDSALIFTSHPWMVVGLVGAYTVPGFPLVNLIILCKSLICLGIKYLWVFFLFLFMLSNLSLNYHKIFYRQQQESTETVYFHIPSQLGMEITHSLLPEWLPPKWGAARLPCSRVQLGCHAAVTIASFI